MWDDGDNIAEEKENISNLRRKRNTWPRPGGSNDPSKGRPLYWERPWGIILRDPHLQDIGYPERKIFMRRFQTPYPIYKRLLEWTKGWHERFMTDFVVRPRYPKDLKLLGCLRICCRAACFDNIEELSGVNKSTMHSFFHKFSIQGREQLYPLHFNMPSTLEYLK